MLNLDYGLLGIKLHESEINIRARHEISPTLNHSPSSGGWWRYEERMCEEIELKYSLNPKEPFEILICGQMYVVDFTHMIQYAKHHPSRSRKIKRELLDKVGTVKGVAGIH